MKIHKEEIPVAMRNQGTTMRNMSGYGGMTIAYNELPAGTDFTPLLKGLPNDHCHCPHWGYLMEGSMRIVYTDGSEEMLQAGDIFYLPAGHTAIVEKDVKFMDFSPTQELNEVLGHVAKKMAELA